MKVNLLKKYIGMMVITALILSLTACGSDGEQTSQKEYQITESDTWTDGTYTEIATGKKGNFEVTITIESGKIVSIEVGDNEETPDKGGVAISELPDKIIDAQTYDVDAVSGATVPSDGLKDAVARCLERASE